MRCTNGKDTNDKQANGEHLLYFENLVLVNQLVCEVYIDFFKNFILSYETSLLCLSGM